MRKRPLVLISATTGVLFLIGTLYLASESNTEHAPPAFTVGWFGIVAAQVFLKINHPVCTSFFSPPGRSAATQRPARRYKYHCTNIIH